MSTINDCKKWLGEVDIVPCDYESPIHLVQSLKYAALYGKEYKCGFFIKQIVKGANTFLIDPFVRQIEVTL